MRSVLLAACLVAHVLGSAQWGAHDLEFTETSEPRCVRIGDLDGDGDGDIVACSYMDNRLLWYEFQGFGTFSEAHVILDRSGPGLLEIDLADFDGDGDLDIAGSWDYSDEVAWLANTGNGTFGALQVIDVIGAVQFRQLLAADLDGDGDQDLVSTIKDGPLEFTWYANDGTGAFSGPQVIAASPLVNDPRKVQAKDLDGDGDIDLFFLDGSGGRWLANDGAGAFNGPYFASVGMTSLYSPLGTGDLDGDGDEDMISHYFTLRWYANVGGSFSSSESASWSTIPFPQSLRTGDLDNDGDIDMVVGGGSDVAWHANNGSGNFGTPLLLSDSCTMVSWMELGDVDLDGDLDIACVSRDADFVAWIENLGGGSFGAMVPLDTSESRPLLATVADVDGDGDTDIIRASSINDELGLLTNQGGGAFAAATPISNAPVNYTSITSTDLDGDQDLDLLTTYTIGGAGEGAAIWHANNGLGGFAGPAIIMDSVNALAAVASDVDLDGDLDVVVLTNGNAFIHFNDGTGSFSPVDSLTLTGSPFAMAMGDVDGDLDEDLVLSFTSGAGQAISLFPNDGTGTFGPQGLVDSTLFFATAMRLIDLDGNGYKDLLFRRWSALHVCWNSSGVLGPSQPISLALNQVGSHLAADLNNDGAWDLVTCGTGPDPLAVRLHLNDGSGGFLPGTSISQPVESTLALNAADLDGDGDTDVLGHSGTLGLMRWYENPGISTGLSFATTTGRLQAWPNPFSQILTITTEEELMSDDAVRVIDAMGREVLRTSGHGTDRLELRTGNLASGHYTIMIVRQNGERELVRVIAQ